MPLAPLSPGLSATRVPFGRVCQMFSIRVLGTSTQARAKRGCYLAPLLFSGIMSMRAPKIAWNGFPIRVGVIGGSGLYKLEGIEIIDFVNPETVRLVACHV